MIVTMVAMRMVQVSFDEVVGVVAVRDGRMSAIVAVAMLGAMAAALVAGRAGGGVLLVDGEPVLVGVPLVGMVEVAVVEIVHVPFVDDRGVTAVGAVDVVVLCVRLVVAHRRYLSRREHPDYIRTFVQMCRCLDVATVGP